MGRFNCWVGRRCGETAVLEPHSGARLRAMGEHVIARHSLVFRSMHANAIHVESNNVNHARPIPNGSHSTQLPLSIVRLDSMSRTEKLAVQPDLGAGGSECISVPTSQASALLSSLGNFLTVAIHSILFHRALYPAATFLTARAYNLPVHQSRHPGVCAWIRDAVSASLAQIRAGSVRSLALVIHAPNSFEVLERWIFDLQTLPASWGDRDVPMGAEDWAAGQAGGLEGPNDETVNWTDVNEGLRGALSRIAQAGQGRPDLPQGSTFTLAVELRDESQAPIKVSQTMSHTC